MIASDAMDYAAAPPRRRRGSFERRLFMPAFVFVVVVSFRAVRLRDGAESSPVGLPGPGPLCRLRQLRRLLTDRPGIGKTLIFTAGCLAVTVPLGVLFALLLNEIGRAAS